MNQHLEALAIESAHSHHGDSSSRILVPTHQESSPPIRSANSLAICGANKPRIPFDEAKIRVIEYGNGLRSDKAPLSQIRVAGDRVFSPNNDLAFKSRGLHSLCDVLGAPAQYLETLHPKLRDQIISYHLREAVPKSGKLNDSNSRLLYRDGELVGIGRADLRVLEARDVVNAVQDELGIDASSLEVQDLEIGDESFRLDIVSTSISEEVRVGDVLQAGVRVEHSLTGDRATTVLGYVVRLLCTNGMTHRTCLGARKTPRTRRLNADQENAGMLQIEQIKNLTRDARKGLEANLGSIRQLAGRRADLHEARRFLSQARMGSAAMNKQLERAWEIEGSERTAFGIFNAMTRLATHGADPDSPRDLGPPPSDRQRAILARLAGIYANQSTHICEKCFSVLNSASPN